MSIFEIFLIIYIIVFIVYGSKYSSNMQELTMDLKLLKIDGINVKKVNDRIVSRTEKSLKMRKSIWIVETTIFAAHLLLLILNIMSSIHFINALLLFCSSLIFIVIVHWLKGAGTLPNKPIFNDNDRFN